MGCPETSVATNQRCVTLQEGEDNIFIPAETKNHERSGMYSF